jgi:tyrosyl-tRNA synthetase
MTIIETLSARGFLKTSTDLEVLSKHLEEQPRTFYIGFDPTGDSLHIGHLLQVMVMSWLQKAGHRPIAVIGGGTAMVGDPSGKTEVREMLTPEVIAHNTECFRKQLSSFLKVSDPNTTEFDAEGNSAILVDNNAWLRDLNYIDFLREIGRHFSINRMLGAEGVKQRLERDQGLSFIEFNYHLLQSYDYLVLNERYACSLQVGGDDQWFNILGGVDLIRRVQSKSAFAFTTPLITTADGKKMGKTEKGATWIDPAKVSPYDYYQYWVNVQDRDVERFLKLYTFVDLEKIAGLCALQGAEIREAKRVLAWEATALAHGAEAADAAAAAAAKVFSGGASKDMPTHPVAFPGRVLDVYVASGLAQSKGAARRLIQQGGARFESEKILDVEYEIAGPGVLWAGKKRAVRLVAE